MSNNLRAVLDIGSNTIRLLIAETHKTSTKKIHYQHQIVRLGQGLEYTGQLSDEGQERALSAFQMMIKVCQSYGIQAESMVAVATAAVRGASNGINFVSRVKAELGLCIHIISGEVEAELALQGAKEELADNVGRDMLLFDIGGGSTEFTRVHEGVFKDSVSMKLGVVRLTETYLKTNPPSAEDYVALKVAAAKFIDGVERSWGGDMTMPKYLVGTAGTVTTLAAIAQNMTIYDATQINDYHMSLASFQTLRDDLVKKSNDQRLAIAVLEKGREDVIVAGLAIIDVMLERWAYDELTAVDSGLLEGLLKFSPQ